MINVRIAIKTIFQTVSQINVNNFVNNISAPVHGYTKLEAAVKGKLS